MVIAYGIGMFFYNRRMAKKIADASLYVNTLPATGMQQDEKDAVSLEKVEVDDVHYENTVRV